MAKKFISAGTLPFSKAVATNEKYIIEVSGQVGMDPATGKLKDGIGQQTVQALENIGKILEEVGCNFSNITKVRIYLLNMTDYQTVNTIYSKYFKENYPARVALAVKELPLGALIEIECTATSDKIK